MVRRVHAVKVAKVEARVRPKQLLCTDLEAVAAVRRVLRWLTCVKLRVAAEEDALELAAKWRTVTSAVVLHRGEHSAALHITETERKMFL